MLYLAATAEPQRGWGNITALIGAAAAFWLFTYLWGRWRGAPALSPTAPELPAGGGVNPQITAGVDPSDPADDPSRPALGATVAHAGTNRVAVPPAPRPTPAAGHGADLDTWVAGQVATSRRPVEIISEARTRFRRSEATVKRSIRRARTQPEVTS